MAAFCLTWQTWDENDLFISYLPSSSGYGVMLWALAISWNGLSKRNPHRWLRDEFYTWYLANMYFAQKRSDAGCLYQIDKLCSAAQICNVTSTNWKRNLLCWVFLLTRSIILLEGLYHTTLPLIFSTVSPFRYYVIRHFVFLTRPQFNMFLLKPIHPV